MGFDFGENFWKREHSDFFLRIFEKILKKHHLKWSDTVIKKKNVLVFKISAKKSGPTIPSICVKYEKSQAKKKSRFHERICYYKSICTGRYEKERDSNGIFHREALH